MTTRLAKFISDAGLASRRGAELLISQGRVKLNGRKVITPAVNVCVGDSVELDGEPVKALEKIETYAFFKPLNTITSAKDPQGRKTIYDVLPQKYRHLKYIGRLDYKTDGLLLMTNSGGLARKLTLPSSNIPRTYLATVQGEVTDKILEPLRRGITIQGIRYRPMKITASNSSLKITITEGKNREVRKTLAAVGLKVKTLRRISYGDITLGSLLPGNIKPVSSSTFFI